MDSAQEAWEKWESEAHLRPLDEFGERDYPMDAFLAGYRAGHVPTRKPVPFSEGSNIVDTQVPDDFEPPVPVSLLGTAPASEVPDLQAGIERVLGEHRWDWEPGGPIYRCICGDEVYADQRRDDMNAHVASAIVAYLHRKGER